MSYTEAVQLKAVELTAGQVVWTPGWASEIVTIKRVSELRGWRPEGTRWYNVETDRGPIHCGPDALWTVHTK